MKWQELSGPEVAELAKKTEVAILPIGSLEMHGPHLPTGCDVFEAEGVAVAAAQRELAVVLPALPWNIADQMKCYPGTISIPVRIAAKLQKTICLEAARNGFWKIICLVGHGGSQIVVDIVQAEFLEAARRSRSKEEVYPLVFWVFLPSLAKDISAKLITTPSGHGCEWETSVLLALRPDLVDIEKVTETGPINPKAIPEATYRLDWNKQVPKGYIGEPMKATSEKGEQIVETAIENLVKIIREVKRYNPRKDV